jgi:hypothetical protein
MYCINCINIPSSHAFRSSTFFFCRINGKLFNGYFHITQIFQCYKSCVINLILGNCKMKILGEMQSKVSSVKRWSSEQISRLLDLNSFWILALLIVITGSSIYYYYYYYYLILWKNVRTRSVCVKILTEFLARMTNNPASKYRLQIIARRPVIWRLLWFSSFPTAKFDDNILIRSRCLPSTSFLIHFSLIILTFVAV